MDARSRTRAIIFWSQTPAAPGLHRLKRLPAEIEQGLQDAFEEGRLDGIRMEKAEQAARKKGPDPVAEWGRRLSGNRLLTDEQALEWLEDEARRRARP